MSESQYLRLVEQVLEYGEEKSDRTGTGILSLFGPQIEFNLQEGFPLLTTKKVFFKAIAYELLWFLLGETNIEYLTENNVHIWDEWADTTGDIGPLYGAQWRSWGFMTGEKVVDQISDLIFNLRHNPNSRRHVISAWNPSKLPDPNLIPCDNPPLGNQALAPCHCLFQFYVREGKYLDCKLYQRSADIFLGVPFNIASYALLTHMIAQVCDLEPGRFVHTFGDAHIYMNHISQLKTQLEREPREFPTLELNKSIDDIDEFDYDDIRIVGYNPWPAIKGAKAV